MVHYEQVFRTLHITFQSILATYRRSCQRLLCPLAIPESDFDELTEKPFSDKWKDPRIDMQLRSRLGSSYQNFKDMTGELNEKIKKLCRKLRLNDQYLESSFEDVVKPYL